ncbi:HEPN domain-containing protein [Mesorhizobium sp. M1233]|uniref:hypothetical protein n=1 Tax=Mesorhizobium sp. M1233 TaxID=2957072 RepID=UPI003336D946
MAKANTIGSEQRKELVDLAISLIEAFLDGVVPNEDSSPFDLGDWVGTYFVGSAVRFSKTFLSARRAFALRAAKLLKAKAGHETSISEMTQKVAQETVAKIIGATTPAAEEDGLPDEGAEPSTLSAEKRAQLIADGANELVDLVIAEGARTFIQIEPNFLVSSVDAVKVGRVTVMSTADAQQKTAVADNPRITLAAGEYPNLRTTDGVIHVGMPRMVWVVEVPAAKENVAEESKWLIDVAISFIRLAFKEETSRFPTNGEIEPHPTRPTDLRPPHVTLEGTTASAGGKKVSPLYELDAATIEHLCSKSLSTAAEAIFDPPKGSLALRVAQGLGWMTRGRQAFDRAERLLALFTALEALLSSDDKSAPVTQTISRYASVIYASHIPDRVQVYNQIKSLYSVRSKVVHAGERDVLWQEVNRLQRLVEAVFWVVINRCDLRMGKQASEASLSDASHGIKWAFSVTDAEEPQPEDGASA